MHAPPPPALASPQREHVSGFRNELSQCSTYATWVTTPGTHERFLFCIVHHLYNIFVIMLQTLLLEICQDLLLTYSLLGCITISLSIFISHVLCIVFMD
jgi:hypothetical protein